jgi:uncharacterized protein YndB with AHSA1/START domain
MPDILHDFSIDAPASAVYQAMTTPAGLDAWWTARSAGTPKVGSEYQLWFGPEYDWRATVVQASPDLAFQLEMTRSDPDWNATRIGFRLTGDGKKTHVAFYHTGWPEVNAHYRTSCYCWAMYLRILKRYLEAGEQVPYEQRLSV